MRVWQSFLTYLAGLSHERYRKRVLKRYGLIVEKMERDNEGR